MDRLGLLKTLITALDEGSLSRAGRRQGITQSAVSQQIRVLEQNLGHQLLFRTASGVHATRAGALAAQHARQLLMTYEALESDLSTHSDHLSGTYRISVGTILGRTVFGPLLLKINQKFADLNIEMGTDDRYVDVVREGYDLAIRAGKIGNQDGFGRKIAQLDTVLVATPDYLNKHGRPRTTQDLMKLKFIRYNMENTSSQITVKSSGFWTDTHVKLGFAASDPQVVMQALESGAGFAKVVRFLVEDKLADGSLEQILPDVELEPKEIFAVYPVRNGPDQCRQAVIDGFLDIVAKRSDDVKPDCCIDHSVL
ncbi:MAG: LysR family transcriptional regulator [Roseobacter sp.]